MMLEHWRFPESEETTFALNPVSLRFRKPEIEQNFVAETLKQSINFIRAYLVAGTGLYLLFGALDAIVGGNSVTALWTIRYGLVAPMLVAIFVATFFPIFFRIPQFFLGSTMVAAGFGVIAMTAIMDPPFNSQYYAGLVMVVIYCGNLIHLKYANALSIAALLVASYFAVSLWVNPVPGFYFFTNNLFLVMATGIGLFSNYLQETYLRRTYVSRKIIQARNELTYKLLEKANVAQGARREFLATVSHELRTPLNAIIGFSEILKNEMFGEFLNERYSSCARDIHHSGTHLLTILNEILDVVRNDSAEMQLQDDEMDLSECIRGCLGIFRNEAGTKKIELTSAGIERPLIIMADEKRIRQILLNLLSNAVKFTPESGRIRVTVAADHINGISISVSDTGIGIAAEDIGRAMRPYEQIAAPINTTQRGTGLGLSITEKLAMLHGGSMHIESAPGKGTTVSILLPRSRFIVLAGREPLRAAS